jgi:hypothetical protein
MDMDMLERIALEVRVYLEPAIDVELAVVGYSGSTG